MKKQIVSLLLTLIFAISMIPSTAYAATVKISKKAATMEVDSTLTLKITGTDNAVTWKTSKKAVATVSKAGKVTAKGEGTTNITATVNSKKYICTVTVVDSNKVSDKGSRKNPYILKDGATLTVFDYDDNPQKFKIRLNEVIDGPEANDIVYEENMFNDKPDGSNRWVIYKFDIEYIKGDSELEGSDIISTSYIYNENSTKKLDLETAVLTEKYTTPYNFNLYEGGEGEMTLAVLLNDDIEYVTFKISFYDENYKSVEYWLSTK